MKNIFCAVLILFAAVGLFAQNGVLKEFTGTVELKPAGAAEFAPAQTGSEVARNTIVSTGFKSTAIIEVGSSQIMVRPLTRLTLTEIQSSSGTESLNMSLQSGRVRVDVKPPAGTKTNFAIQSPIATASVRGTSFEFDTRRITVYEGTVSFLGKNGMEMLIPAGQESFVGNEGEAADPLALGAAELLPAPPVGVSTSGKKKGVPVPTSGSIPIIIEY